MNKDTKTFFLLHFAPLCLSVSLPPAAKPPSAPILHIEAGMHTATINRS